MFSIGEFARHGRVSVRMLRHYDSLGLLRPAHCRPAHRVPVATRQHSSPDSTASSHSRILGFTLSQVQSILDDKIGTEELHGMLRLRRGGTAHPGSHRHGQVGPGEAQAGHHREGGHHADRRHRDQTHPRRPGCRTQRAGVGFRTVGHRAGGRAVVRRTLRATGSARGVSRTARESRITNTAATVR